jgi:hypothetical protein
MKRSANHYSPSFAKKEQDDKLRAQMTLERFERGCAKMSQRAKERWADPAKREKMKASLKSGWTPEARARQSKIRKAYWAKRKP